MQQALERYRTLFEHCGQPVVTEPVLAMVRPMAHLGLYLADSKAWFVGRRLEWLTANEGFRRRVLDLGRVGPPGVA